jgi:hypothetical protein
VAEAAQSPKTGEITLKRHGKIPPKRLKIAEFKKMPRTIFRDCVKKSRSRGIF